MKRDYPRDTPFWSFVTLVALGGWAFVGGRWVYRKATAVLQEANARRIAERQKVAS